MSNSLSLAPQKAIYTKNGVIVEDLSAGIPMGVDVQSGNVINTFGVWTTLDAALSEKSYLTSFMVRPKVAAILGGVSLIHAFCIEIGKGVAASEVTISRHSFEVEYDWVSDVGITLLPAYLVSLSVPIEVGSGLRLAARASDNNANNLGYTIAAQYYQSLEG